MFRLSKIFSTLAAVALVAVIALPAMAGGAEVGQKAPDFTLTDHAGKTHKLSDYAGKIVVVEWTNPQCPFVVRHYKADTMTNLAKKFGEDVVWLAVDSSHFVTAESASKWAQKEEIPYPILLDASGEVGKTYGAKTTPHMFVVAKDGTLVYNGAIDDDPRGGSKEPMNYVAAAVQASMKGEAVAQTTSKPYGCSVKYGKADSAKAAKASR